MTTRRQPAIPGLLAAVWLCVGWGTMQLSAGGGPARDAKRPVYEESFEGGQARGWELQPGWQVAQYERGRWALVGRGHHHVTYTAGAWADSELTVRLRIVKGRIHLNYRLTEDGRRYFVGVAAGRVSLHKTLRAGPRGVHPHLQTRPARIRKGQWHEIRIDGKGGTIYVHVDGRACLAYRDRQPLLRGGIGLETLDESEVYVDAVRVTGQAVDTSSLRPGPDAKPRREDRSQTGPKWVRTGGPLGGLGYDVRMRTDEPNVLYVTDAWAGVHVSADGGRTWRPSNRGILTRKGPSGDGIPIFCLTLDPHNPHVIWAGTENVRGIYKSTDGGRTWQRKDRGVREKTGITFRGFTVDPEDPRIVYAAAEISSVAWARRPVPGREFDRTRGVVYKSVDAGENWQAVWRGDNLARYVWIHPRNSDIVYVSTGIFDREAANSDHRAGPPQPGGVGVLKSTDGGKTWIVLGRRNGLTNLYIGSLFMHPKDPEVLLAGAGNNAWRNGGGVFLTTDGGKTWKRTLDLPQVGAHSVEFSVSHPAIAYAGNPDAIYRSEDGGLTWKVRTEGEHYWGPPGVRAGFPIDFQVDRKNPDRLFVNNYGGGNFLSEDGGRTWKAASAGYTGALMRDIAVDPRDARTVYVAGRSGLFRSANAGAQWTGLNYPPAHVLDWSVVAIAPGDARHLLAASNWDGQIFRSVDGARTWHSIRRAPGPRMAWRAIAFAPSERATVYAGSSAYYSAGQFDDRLAAAGIAISRDGGRTWRPANDRLSARATVADLAVDPKDPRVVYAATCKQGVLKSTNRGGAWKAVNQGLTVRNLHALAIHPRIPQRIYAGAEQAGVYLSTDGGGRWQPCNAGMNPEASIQDIVIHSQEPNILYAADIHSGVYRSADAGRSWTQITNGLRTRAVNALALSADGSTLYAATEGEGVFRLDLGRAGK